MPRSFMARRPHRQSSRATRGAQDGSPAQILGALKQAWRAADWDGARLAYNTWTNRTGRKREAKIESEMLFRAASTAFAQGKPDRALARLEEALSRDPGENRRYAVCKALCLARLRRLSEAAKLLASCGDLFTAAVIEEMASHGGRTAPEAAPVDPAFEPSMLLSFWRELADPVAADPSSSVLRGVRRAYHALLRGEEPDALLETLKYKPGFERLGAGLQLASAVALRRTMRVRNLLSRHAGLFGDDWSLAVLNAHLRLLLREREYREIEALEGILAERGLPPPGLERVRDERLFAAGLQEAEAGRWEQAHECFSAIRSRTPSVLHNLALVCQKGDRLAEANEHWTALLRQEKRPKRSDPELERLAYVAAAKAIAANYLAEDAPARAIPFLKDAHGLCADDPEVLDQLAEACRDAGADDQALHYARLWYHLKPEDTDALVACLLAALRSGSSRILLSLFDEEWERMEKLEPVLSLVCEVYAELAWRIRTKEPEKAREIAGRLRPHAPDDPFLVFLEGWALAARPEEARKHYERAAKEAEGHSTQLLLGMALYDEGYPDLSFRLFEKIAECGCDRSLDLLHDIVAFLAGEGEADKASKLCTQGVEAGAVSLYTAADMFYEADEPFHAREFSGRLVEESAADEEDHFLHILILNACGDAAETLAFTERTIARFEFTTSEEGFIDVLKDIAKQVRLRGRARIPHDPG